jgi:hypothetical protein
MIRTQILFILSAFFISFSVLKAQEDCEKLKAEIQGICQLADQYCDITLSCRAMVEKCTEEMQLISRSDGQVSQDSCNNLGRCFGNDCQYVVGRSGQCKNVPNIEKIDATTDQYFGLACPGATPKGPAMNDDTLTCLGHETNYFLSLDQCSIKVERFNLVCSGKSQVTASKICDGLKDAYEDHKIKAIANQNRNHENTITDGSSDPSGSPASRSNSRSK